MTTGRLEAFSDGVIAIIITIAVLLVEPPDGCDWAAFRASLAIPAVYAVSFVMVGMHWANHHHLFQIAKRVNGKILWANLFYLFTLSFYPVATGWVGKSRFACVPTVVYVGVSLAESIAYILLQHAIVSSHDCLRLKKVVNETRKEGLTLLLEAAALACAFSDRARILSFVLLLAAAAPWIVPDLRLQRVHEASKRGGDP